MEDIQLLPKMSVVDKKILVPHHVKHDNTTRPTLHLKKQLHYPLTNLTLLDI